MRAVVVYESMFGNTKSVAEAVGRGLQAAGEVVVTDLGHVPDLEGVGLLVVGAPTHAFGMSRPQSREEAAKRTADGHPVTEGAGMREWIYALPPVREPVAMAAFDTKVMKPLTGSAAKKAAHLLEAKGYRLLVEPEHFGVGTEKVPDLDVGELEHAESWGRALADRVAAPA
jgi:hypothetical protein